MTGWHEGCSASRHFSPTSSSISSSKKKKKHFWKHLMLSVVSAVSPGRSFGSWYCQKKHPVITRDKTRKNTKPSWVHFTFILLVFVSPSNLTVAAGAGAAAAGDGLNTNTQQHTAGQQRKCAELLYTHTLRKSFSFLQGLARYSPPCHLCWCKEAEIPLSLV